VAITMS